ncbi:MAG: hypothetical protein O3A51_03430, partial [Verrucomicrobia bacterium]|nr:hypothetical protein [Verrucomicrobiota bacterium]
MHDGIHDLLDRDQMVPAARKLRDTYAITPGAPFYQREFGYMCLSRWTAEGFDNHDDWGLFGFDEPGHYSPKTLGWCDAAFFPAFDEEVIEDRGDCEVIVDKVGRHLLVFKGRRTGFMPEYIDHPVKDIKSWEEQCKWRMDPTTPERLAHI